MHYIQSLLKTFDMGLEQLKGDNYDGVTSGIQFILILLGNTVLQGFALAVAYAAEIKEQN